MPLQHPYENLRDGRWLRGNLHTHTTKSDGARPQQDVIDDYAARGYGFLALSDHDVYTSHDDYKTLNARGMILVPGNEVSAGGPHIQHVNADRRVDPVMPRQGVFDQIKAARGFSVVNHPNWGSNFEHCSNAQMQEWTGYAGIEIYNGVISRLQGTPYATDRWDILLSKGRRVWGFANDDSHAAVGDVELGWNVAYVSDPTADGVTAALQNGRFYASTGVTIDTIEVDQAARKITVEAKNAHRIVASQQNGQRIATVDGARIELVVPAAAQYVRFECWGVGEKFAWTQPFWSVA
jgi:hypothetical protein